MSDDKLGFSTILASTVHDMKNSINMLMDAFTQLSHKLENLDENEKNLHSIMQYESTRLSSSLVQLLGLYKLENQQLPVNINHQIVDEFLEEIAIQHHPLLTAKNIQLELDIEEDLEGYFDPDLIGSIINNVISNTIRYTKTKINISAWQDKFLVIQIADDGPGYPKVMIESPETYILGINHISGSTGLGLYFASQVAKTHKLKELTGYIELENGKPYNGGVFRLFLP